MSAALTASLKLGQLANGSSRLADLLAEGQNSVRSDPANAKRRVMLFQLMILSGQWDRALTEGSHVAMLHRKLAQAYERIGNTDQANYHRQIASS